jgi:hypothetical protein
MSAAPEVPGQFTRASVSALAAQVRAAEDRMRRDLGLAPSFPPRDSPQPEDPARLPRCEECRFLRDALGHFWVCVAPGGRMRRKP